MSNFTQDNKYKDDLIAKVFQSIQYFLIWEHVILTKEKLLKDYCEGVSLILLHLCLLCSMTTLRSLLCGGAIGLGEKEDMWGLLEVWKEGRLWLESILWW